MPSNKKPDTLKSGLLIGEKESSGAKCLICGRDIQMDEEVLPILCLEPGHPIGMNCVVCKDCVDDFDSRIYSTTFVQMMEMPSNGNDGLVM